MATSRITDSRLYGAAVEDMGAFPERMRDDTDLLGGLPLSERAMLALGERSANRPHARSSMRSRWPRGEREPGSARSSARTPGGAPYPGPEAVRALLDPARCPGLAGRIVDEVAGE